MYSFQGQSTVWALSKYFKGQVGTEQVDPKNKDDPEQVLSGNFFGQSILPIIVCIICICNAYGFTEKIC